MTNGSSQWSLLKCQWARQRNPAVSDLMLGLCFNCFLTLTNQEVRPWTNTFQSLHFKLKHTCTPAPSLWMLQVICFPSGLNICLRNRPWTDLNLCVIKASLQLTSWFLFTSWSTLKEQTKMSAHTCGVVMISERLFCSCEISYWTEAKFQWSSEVTRRSLGWRL